MFGYQHQLREAIGVDVKPKEVIYHLGKDMQADTDKALLINHQAYFSAPRHAGEVFAWQPGGSRAMAQLVNTFDLPGRRG